MEEQVQQNDEIEIDLVELFHVLISKAGIILLCTVIGAVAAFGVTSFLMTPKYTSSASVYIFSENSLTTTSDVQLGSSLTEDFILLAKSRPVIESVIENLNLDDDYETIANSIDVTNPEESHFLQISVTNTDPELAADIANEMAVAVKKQLEEIMPTGSPSIVEDAIVTEEPSSPSIPKNTLIGALAGFVLAAAAVIVLHLMDDTIKNEDDVKRYLNANTLAAIPLSKETKGKH